MKLLIIALALFAVISAHDFSKDTKVILGKFERPTKDNFKTEIGQIQHSIVLFYQTWCGHCKTLIPKFEKAASANEGTAKYIAVDCGKADYFCKAMKVASYPTIYFIEDFSDFRKYEGGSTE